MYESVDCDLLEGNLNRNFNSLCDWFAENKLSIHFAEDKTDSIIFGSKRKLKNLCLINIRRGDYYSQKGISDFYLSKFSPIKFIILSLQLIPKEDQKQI